MNKKLKLITISLVVAMNLITFQTLQAMEEPNNHKKRDRFTAEIPVPEISMLAKKAATTNSSDEDEPTIGNQGGLNTEGKRARDESMVDQDGSLPDPVKKQALSITDSKKAETLQSRIYKAQAAINNPKDLGPFQYYVRK